MIAQPSRITDDIRTDVTDSGKMRQIDDFIGQWQLERQIDDARAGRMMHFAGTACLSNTGPDVWHYHESGILSTPGHADMVAEQTYLWRPHSDGIGVYFSDGRFFHAFDPDSGQPVAEHFCDPDQYDVQYDFRNWPEWRTNWRVSGPRKDYRIVNHFCR